VLRDGRHVATENTGATNRDRVIHQMVGREVVSVTPRHLDRELGDELLRVENLSSPGRFRAVNFSLRAGEVLGLAGLVGAGRTEVARALFGVDVQATGNVFVRGKPLGLGNVNTALAAGIGLYLLAWAGAVAIWREVAVAEVARARKRLEERALQAREAAEAAAKAEARRASAAAQ